MILIVGLGNYPPRYHDTRHNFGFLAIDQLAKKFHFSPWKLEKKFHGEIATGELEHQKTLLLKPHTLMNLSGKSVQSLAHFYKIPTDKIILLYDDLDTTFGQIRWKESGSSGGQRGVEDIIRALGTPKIPRVKFGIKSLKQPKIDAATFVLNKFTPEEKELLPHILEQGLEKITQHIS